MFSHSFSASSYARAAAALVGLVVAAQADAGVNVFSVGGTTATASIQPTVDSFRSALGDPNNLSAPGPLGGGRREINWDGGGVNTPTTTVGTLSAFTDSRGATFTTPGTGFLQTPLNDAALTGIQPSYATTFGVFSLQRIFTPLASNVTEVTFSLPGTNGATDATVVGFGAVFSDVDLTNTTTIELYDQSNASLGVFGVPPGNPGAANGAALSFLGLLTNAGEKIARVLITTGNQALGAPDANGDNADVVAMDDFLYSEPIAVAEPATTVLALAAFGALAACRRSVPRRAGRPTS